MSRYIITVNNFQHVVDVEKTGADEYAVTVDGAAVAPASTTSTPAAKPAATAPAPVAAPAPVPVATSAPAAAGSTQLTAPMPGVIDSVVAQVGQQVAPGDTLVVLEAMKMKNDLRSEVSGTIAAVLVTPGQQVKFGEPLINFAE